MLIDIFITLQIVAITLFVLSLIFKNINFEATIILMVISTLFFFTVGVSSYNIEHPVVIIDGSLLTSTTTIYTTPAIAWLNIGLGFITLAFTFFTIFYTWKEK